MRSLAAGISCAGAITSLAFFSQKSYKRAMYRGRVDFSRPGPWWESAADVFGYKYVPLLTMDVVTYSNEIPWDPTHSQSGVLVRDRVYTAAIRGREDTDYPIDAVFEADTSYVGTFIPLDDYSNLDFKVLRNMSSLKPS